jgi:primosomal protein N' (replication factor Y)
VASVVVDRPQPHLDRPFEYAVLQSLDEAAQPGVRVKVRFGGQDVDGFVVERLDEAEHTGTLTPLRRVVSAEPVLGPEVLVLARAVAARYAGTLADVLRLAVPPRHARVEQELWPERTDARARPTSDAAAGVTGTSPPDGPGSQDVDGGTLWEPYTGGAAFLRRVAAGEAPRAVWQALPGSAGPAGSAGSSWADAIAAAVLVAHDAGRGALVVVPSGAEVRRVEHALARVGLTRWAPGTGDVVRLVADDGPSVRYRSFLAASRGLATVVVGTRAAAFAPVKDLGLIVCWDDGDHLLAEPRAPYPHAREVLALRAGPVGAALMVGGHIRTVAAHRWTTTGWAHPLVAPRDVVRARTPRISALTSVELAAEGAAAAARLPAPAWRAIRDGLTRGPVLVQVPRAGYVPTVACQRCRTPARCVECAGPLSLPGPGAPPQCRWCGRLAAAWSCPECGGVHLRSLRVGSERTAEELGRAFPGALVRSSGAGATGGVLASVGAEAALVVATPGAEPEADGGYAAAVLLDAATVTARDDLDVGEQALRTWMAAAALVRPAPEGVVLLVGDAAPAVTQAFVRWDAGGFAARELAERDELRLPPAVHHLTLDGARDGVEALLGRLVLPAGTVVLGPLPVDEQPQGPPDQAAPVERAATLAGLEPHREQLVRAVVRGPWTTAVDVTAAVRAAQAVRSARGDGGHVRVRVEPGELW